MSARGPLSRQPRPHQPESLLIPQAISHPPPTCLAGVCARQRRQYKAGQLVFPALSRCPHQRLRHWDSPAIQPNNEREFLRLSLHLRLSSYMGLPLLSPARPPRNTLPKLAGFCPQPRSARQSIEAQDGSSPLTSFYLLSSDPPSVLAARQNIIKNDSLLLRVS